MQESMLAILCIALTMLCVCVYCTFLEMNRQAKATDKLARCFDRFDI